MNFTSFFNGKTKNVVIVKTIENGVIFCVKESKGLLRPEYGSHDGKGLYSLVLGGIPLIKFHGDEYMCPTCQKLIAAGYGIDKYKDKDGILSQISERMNSPFESTEKAFEDLKPLLALFPIGYYTLTDELLFPTNGEDAFFWDITNTPKLNQATCPIYDRDSGNWSNCGPKYLVPTQSPKLFNRARAEYYRDSYNNTRAVAYSLEGHLCALLDGHHKATAAAMKGSHVNALLISSAQGLIFPKPNERQKGALRFKGATLYENEFLDDFEKVRKSFGGNRMSENEYETYVSMIEDSFDNYRWPNDIMESAKQYYDAYTCACIDWAGDLSDKRLSAILKGEENIENYALAYILRSLHATKDSRFIDFGIAIGREKRYRDEREVLFPLLAKENDKRIEDFFVDFLIEDDGMRPWITKTANEYFIANERST